MYSLLGTCMDLLKSVFMYKTTELLPCFENGIPIDPVDIITLNALLWGRMCDMCSSLFNIQKESIKEIIGFNEIQHEPTTVDCEALSPVHDSLCQLISRRLASIRKLKKSSKINDTADNTHTDDCLHASMNMHGIFSFQDYIWSEIHIFCGCVSV